METTEMSLFAWNAFMLSRIQEEKRTARLAEVASRTPQQMAERKAATAKMAAYLAERRAEWKAGAPERARRDAKRAEWYRKLNDEVDARRRAEAETAAARVALAQSRPASRKPLDRTRFEVRLHQLVDPHAVMMLCWNNWKDSSKNFHALGAEIDCDTGDVRLAFSYTVRGGHPADLRRKLGRFLNEDREPLSEDQATIRSVDRTRVSD